jgi:histidinol-phosphate aminotransferase
MINKSSIRKYIRPELLSFGAYSAAISPDSLAAKAEKLVNDIIKLDQNENLYGCSPRVYDVLAAYKSYNIYPDAEQTALRQQLAKYTGLGPECIVAANGSNQLLDIITRLFISTGDGVINFVPTFDMYRFSTQVCGGKLIEIQRDNNFAIDINNAIKAIDSNTRLIFLANPNAPTGNLTPQKDIIKLLETGLPVVVDEAYYEFSGVTVVPFMKQYSNLMVVRTFSKWAGLAGLRVGYGLFTPEIAEYLHRIKIPYNVNVAALAAVEESIKDLGYLLDRTKAIIAEKDRMFNELKNIKWLKPYPSQANFILCQVLNGKAKAIHQRLQDKGILVRYFEKPRLESCIRFSVGKPEHTDALLEALREIESSW